MSNGLQNGRAEQAHLNEEWISKYQSKSLGIEELQAASRHLSDCGNCRRVLLGRMGPIRLPEELAEMPEALHLSYEQITAYIDDKLVGADKERIEAHTFICATCSREIEDLRKLDAHLAEPILAEPIREVKPEAPKVSLWERMAQAFQLPGAMPKFGMALGAIIVGAVLLIPGKFVGGGGGGQFDEMVRRTGTVSPGLSLGGMALVIGGVVYIVYRLRRRR